MTSARPWLLIGAAFVLGGVAALATWPRTAAAPAGGSAGTEPPPTPAPAPGPVQGEVPPQPVQAGQKAALLMPDGQQMPLLNGVATAPKVVWGDGPYAPVVRKEFNNGLDWYVHADGTYTTTMMAWRKELGRYDATTLCLRPTKPVAVDDGSGK